ncbi:MAG: amino acid racemase [Clostridia bacterium]|nr:amino acid racemase [Clostridia bacterium]
MAKKRKLLGILGGLGPLSSAYFYELITEHTLAERDQDHIDIILSSRATTPDRTDYILGRSDASPLDYMISDAKSLEVYGATAIVIPCNTAHYFIDQVRASVSVPVPSIITETARTVRECGFRKPAILATEGTVLSGSYQREFESMGMEYGIPDKDTQDRISHLIYGKVKAGSVPEPEELYEAAGHMLDRDCDCAILGCTELSLIGRKMKDNEKYIDSLTVLADTSIRLMGHRTVGMPSYCGK